MKPNSRAGKGVPAAKSGSLSKSCPGKWVPIAGSLATHVKLIRISGKKKLVIWIFCLCRRLVSRSVFFCQPCLTEKPGLQPESLYTAALVTDERRFPKLERCMGEPE